MENRQTVQRQPSTAKNTLPAVSKITSGLTLSWKFLLHLIFNYPLVMFTGLFATFIGLSYLSVRSLMYAGRIEPQETETVNTRVERQIPPPADRGNPIPLWMVAAIAFSCASGCLILFRLLNRPSQNPKLQKNNRYQTRVVQQQQQQRRSQTSQSYQPTRPAPQQKPPVFVPPQPRMQKPPVFVPPQQPAKPGPKPTTSVPPQQPVVTVLPPEHNYPVDRKPQSLADMLDLRKQNSLDTIIRKK